MAPPVPRAAIVRPQEPEEAEATRAAAPAETSEAEAPRLATAKAEADAATLSEAQVWVRSHRLEDAAVLGLLGMR